MTANQNLRQPGGGLLRILGIVYLTTIIRRRRRRRSGRHTADDQA